VVRNHQFRELSAARVSLLITDDLTPSFAETLEQSHQFLAQTLAMAGIMYLLIKEAI
jgi:hypothetical protein